MKRRPFFSVVPRTMQGWALAIGLCAVLAGLAVGHHAPGPGNHMSGLTYSAAGLLAGLFLAAWLLSIGYVYGDARERAMRPVPWVFLVILVPHLLGFLFYFVMRHPLASNCTHCGLMVPAGQRFCSWCGTAQTAFPANAPTGMGQQPTANP